MAPHALHICSSVRVILQLVTDRPGAAILPFDLRRGVSGLSP